MTRRYFRCPNLANNPVCTLVIDYNGVVGTKRFDSEKAGDREVQRTMLELLNQLDGFHPSTDIKVPLCSMQCYTTMGFCFTHF